jgi:small conductance mechanosensitive channel
LTVIGFFLVIALGKLGISITPLIAAIGGLAIGASFAIQGPVSNYGAGLVIILTRMYKVGDTVTVQGCTGVVTDIALAATKMVAEDGEDIIIPNKHIIGEIHRNTYERRLVEASVGIAYGDDPDKAIAVIRDVIKDTVRGATQSAPQIGIEAFDDSAIRIGYRYWVPTMEYFEAQYRVNLEVFKQFANAGVNIPFPQRDVHLINAAGE